MVFRQDLFKQAMFKIKNLKSKRLSLRLVKTSDAEAIFKGYAANPRITKFLTWRPHRSVQEVEDAIKRIMIKGYKQGDCLPWVITKGEGKNVIGMIELRPSRKGGQNHVADIGYVLAESEWGQGYMTEALRAVIKFAFENLKLKRVWAYCDAANKGSAKVMLNAGMKQEGILHRFVVHPNISNQPRDCLCFAIWKK